MIFGGIKSIGNKYAEKKQKYVSSPRSLLNKNTQNFRIVWKIKSEMDTLEKVLGITNHRKRNLAKTLSHNDSVQINTNGVNNDTQNSLRIPFIKTRKTVHNNDNVIKESSVKNLKTFFEKYSSQSDKYITDTLKDNKIIKKIKLHNNFPRKEENILNGRNYETAESKPKMKDIGRINAIHESNNSIDTIEYLSKSSSETIIQEFDPNLNRNNSTEKNLITNSPQNRQTNCIDTIENAKNVVNISPYSIDQIDDIYKTQNISPGKNEEVNTIKERLNEYETSVSQIRAKLQYIINKTDTDMKYSIILRDKSMKKKSTTLENNSTATHNIINAIEVSEENSNSKPLLSTKQIIELYELRNWKSNLHTPIKETYSPFDPIDSMEPMHLNLIQSDEVESVKQTVHPAPRVNEETLQSTKLDNGSNDDEYETELQVSHKNTETSSLSKPVNEDNATDDIYQESNNVVNDKSLSNENNYLAEKVTEPLDKTVISQVLDNRQRATEAFVTDECNIQSPVISDTAVQDEILTAQKDTNDHNITSINATNTFEPSYKDTNTKSSVALSLPEGENRLNILHRKGSRVRSLHPDELSFFQRH